jgi:hypothetical protein
LDETTNEKSPVTNGTTNKVSVSKNSGEKPTGTRSTQQSFISADLNADRCLAFSIDLEQGGDKAGILQLSVSTFTRDGDRLGEPFKLYAKSPAGSSIPTVMTEYHGPPFQIHTSKMRVACLLRGPNSKKTSRVKSRQ